MNLIFLKCLIKKLPLAKFLIWNILISNIEISFQIFYISSFLYKVSAVSVKWFCYIANIGYLLLILNAYLENTLEHLNSLLYKKTSITFFSTRIGPWLEFYNMQNWGLIKEFCDTSETLLHEFKSHLGNKWYLSYY